MKNLSDGERYLDLCFEALELAGEHFRNIEFEECRFSNCNFTEARFQDCKFYDCRFEGCNLSLIELTGSRLFGVTFQESKLVGVNWTKADWAVYHVDFELAFRNCILNDASFFGLTLNDLILSECKLCDADFREGNFDGSTMTYCDFTRSLFLDTSLLRADFSDSSGYAINVLENHVKGARFSRYEALNLLECLDIELVD